MAEYIEREKLPKKKERGFFLDDDFNAGWNACLNNINSIPAADVAPVKHGHWNVYSAKDCLYTCSECHCMPKDKTPYCPNCGAKMDGEE